MWLVTLDRRSRVPLHEQILRQMRFAIEEGRLGPGAQLPSTRGLAADLKVARATVVLAYEHLRAEGLLDATTGGTTRVSSRVDHRPARRPVSKGQPKPALVSARARVLAALPRPTLTLDPRGDDTPRAFMTGQPAVDLFPVEVWGRLVARRWRRITARSIGYGDPRGLRELREAVASYVGRARGVSCTADQVVITQGAQQGLDLLARLLTDPGESIWMEDPGYPGVRAAFAGSGATVVPVPVDAEGLVVQEGIRRAPRARLACVTPSRQMPLGGVMSGARRAQLLQWAAGDARRWIVEDDYDSEFRYAARQVAALQAQDRSGSVVHVGTFTKLLFPALRLGYLILPESLIDACVPVRSSMDFCSPYLEQAVVADFLNDGHFDRHIRRVRTAYRARLEALQDAVAQHMTGLAELEPADAGRAVVLWLEGLREVDACDAAAAAGIRVTPLSLFYADPARPSWTREGVILGYGGLHERDIRDGIAKLARALARLR